MELDDCMTKDCSTIYRFQFASIAFLCGVYLPLTFHSNIWSLYIQPFTPVNCTGNRLTSLPALSLNITPRAFTGLTSIRTYNRTDCCGCQALLNGGHVNDKRLLTLCQEWLANWNEFDVRKATIIDEVSEERIEGKERDRFLQWHLACGQENRKNLMLGSISYSIVELIGIVTIGILADQYGRKLMLLMCLYIPVVNFR